MTFDQCQRALTAVRRRQGTRFPLVRIDYAGQVYRGRLMRADSDPEHGSTHRSPDGYLVLQETGVEPRRPPVLLHIATLEPGSIAEIEAN